MKLLYKAVTRDGKTVGGVIEAKDSNEAASFLRTKGLLPTSIIPKKEGGLSAFLPFLKKSSSKDLVFFTRQLSSMISSGLTLMQTLNILKEQVQNEAMKDIINGIILDVEEGKAFSEALSKFPEVFSPIYISLIKAAETSGLLDKVLLRLADNLEKQQKLKSTVKSALMYPIIVIIGMIIVMSIMMIFVIPQLSVLYENLGVPLPLPTRIIVGMSRFVTTFWPIILAFVVLIIFFYRRWRKTQAGQIFIDDLTLKLPVFGKLVNQSILTEFTRTFGLLIGTGTLVVQSLNQSSDVVGNSIYKNAINGVAKRVEKGLSVADAVASFSVFPPIVVQMVGIGEQTGKLDESLMRVSEYFEREVEQSVKNLTTAMEPFIMVVLGIGVAFLIISIITPIYNLTSSIQ